MPRVRDTDLTSEEQEEIEAAEDRRRAIEVIRWAHFDRDGVEPGLREQGRAFADRYLRSIGLLPPE